jgi:hypothetical protein
VLQGVNYGCGTWFLLLSEEHTLRMFENRVLRIIFLSTEKQQELEGGVVTRSFIIFAFHKMISG